MGGSCSTHGRDRSEDLDGKIISEWVLEKQDEKCVLDSSVSR